MQWNYGLFLAVFAGCFGAGRAGSTTDYEVAAESAASPETELQRGPQGPVGGPGGGLGAGSDHGPCGGVSTGGGWELLHGPDGSGGGTPVPDVGSVRVPSCASDSEG